MIKHKHTEPVQHNFFKLEERILGINDSELNKAKEISKMLTQIANNKGPTLIMATGGSKVVAYYLQSIMERLENQQLLCEVIEPRDYFYKFNRKSFLNLIAISASGNTNGIKEALEDFQGNKFLICQNGQSYDYQVISWGNQKYESEKSFISLASSLGPITLLLDAVSLNEIGSHEVTLINEKIKELLSRSKEKIDRIPIDFKNVSLIQLLSGYETRASSCVLESNLIETGCLPIVVHDKGSFCHGRSNLLFHYPDSHFIFLHHQKKELDDLLIKLINQTNTNITVLDTEDIHESYFWKEYYLILQMYYLSRKIADDKNIDLTQPEYNPFLVKPLYRFRGKM